MRDVTDDIFVIYIMRSPVRRLWSHVQFMSTLTGERDRVADWSKEDFRDFIAHHQLNKFGEYANAISKMESVLSKDEIMIIDYSRIALEPKRVLYEVEDFAKITHHSYDEATIKTIHNGQAPCEAPAAFNAAVVGWIGAELQAMQDAGMPFPTTWLTDFDEVQASAT